MLQNSSFIFTNDKIIRSALKKDLDSRYDNDPHTKVIEELGVTHGVARVDLAVVNGILHGYELKSDLDTLYRLPEQMKLYNSVFDKITLVVGKNHVFDVIKLVPDWWGIVIAKVLDLNGPVSFINIREPEKNYSVDSISIAKFLWREEALNILEKINKADGIRSKPRIIIYEKLVRELDKDTLRDEVRRCLLTRVSLKFEKQQGTSGD